jgi:hypothetical protein
MKIDIKGKLESAYVEVPFDKAKKVFESQGYRIISLSENAYLRMQEGKDAFISQNGNGIIEAFIYLPSKEIYLTKNSPIMENAEEATECNRKGKEFYINEKQIEQLKKDVNNKLAVKFPETENYEIPTDRFGDDAITAFAFEKYAKDYGKFLKDAGINKMPIWFADFKDKPFARKLWFMNLSSRSGLDGDWGICYDYYGARGVCEK